MTRAKQRKLLTAICNNVMDRLLSQSEHWPKEWDGYELRDLAAKAFERGSPHLAPGSRRRKAFLRTLRTIPP